MELQFCSHRRRHRPALHSCFGPAHPSSHGPLYGSDEECVTGCLAGALAWAGVIVRHRCAVRESWAAAAQWPCSRLAITRRCLHDVHQASMY